MEAEHHHDRQISQPQERALNNDNNNDNRTPPYASSSDTPAPALPSSSTPALAQSTNYPILPSRPRHIPTSNPRTRSTNVNKFLASFSLLTIKRCQIEQKHTSSPNFSTRALSRASRAQESHIGHPTGPLSIPTSNMPVVSHAHPPAPGYDFPNNQFTSRLTRPEPAFGSSGWDLGNLGLPSVSPLVGLQDTSAECQSHSATAFSSYVTMHPGYQLNTTPEQITSNIFPFPNSSHMTALHQQERKLTSPDTPNSVEKQDATDILRGCDPPPPVSNYIEAVDEGPGPEDFVVFTLEDHQQDTCHAIRSHVSNDRSQVAGRAARTKPSRSVKTTSKPRKPSLRPSQHKSSALASSASETRRKVRSSHTHGPKGWPRSPPRSPSPASLPPPPAAHPAATVAQPFANTITHSSDTPLPHDTQHHRSHAGFLHPVRSPSLPQITPESDPGPLAGTVFPELSTPVTLPPRHARSIRSSHLRYSPLRTPQPASTPRYKMSPEVRQWIIETFPKNVRRVHKLREGSDGTDDGELEGEHEGESNALSDNGRSEHDDVQA